MVIWVFAGGGEAEAKGLIPFLRKQFPNCEFIPRFPVGYKPGGKPRNPNDLKKVRKQKEYKKGASGSTFRKVLKKRLCDALQYDPPCDLILILDDLDCREPNKERELLGNILRDVLSTREIPCLIGFASPEIEAWIVADWDHIMRQHRKFLHEYIPMKLFLREKYNLNFDNPEIFGTYDKEHDCCRPKLSSCLQESVQLHCGHGYSKDRDSSALIKKLDPDCVRQKCPEFRQWYTQLETHCTP